MSIWLFRAGKNGEYENKFLTDSRVYLTWDNLNINLSKIHEKEELYSKLISLYTLEKEKTAINWAAQIWPIAHRMEKGDWIVLPSKINRTIHFGEVIGDYIYDESMGNPYYHYRDIKWFATDIPRDNFDQDILYSLGAFMTVCKIYKNDAENRLKEMYKNGWSKKQINAQKNIVDDDEITDQSYVDLSDFIFDRISERIIRRFKGHDMEFLIEEILKAKGFQTYRSPEGADQGVDLLASSDTLGFGPPRICVQVKSTDNTVDRPTLDQLIGTMSNYNADYGLLVSWGGFKSTVIKEIPKHFFKVRLWDSKKVIEEIFNNYENLSDEIKAEIPLKRVWMLNDDE